MTAQVAVFDIGMVLLGWSPEAHFDRTSGPDRRRQLFDSVDLYAMNLDIDRGLGFQATVQACAARHPDFAAEILQWHDAWPQMLTGPIEGSVALMRALKARGIPVLALTNFAAETLEIAQGMYDFLNEFDGMYVSGVLGMVKPEPRIYQALEDGTGLPPDALFFVDDRAENCDAAAARGWQVHHFTGVPGLARALLTAGLLQESDIAWIR